MDTPRVPVEARDRDKAYFYYGIASVYQARHRLLCPRDACVAVDLSSKFRRRIDRLWLALGLRFLGRGHSNPVPRLSKALQAFRRLAS